MTPASMRSECTQEAARLLPWFVNGTLAEADARHVADHLAQCATCRGDAAALSRVRTLLRQPDPVEHAPHAGLHKLLQRIDLAERAEPALPVEPPQAQARPGRSRSHGLVRWLSAVLVLQSVALVVVGAMAWVGRSGSDDAARFRTLSTAPVLTAALRVVFTPGMTLAEVQDLLRVNQLVVVAGPSEAGLFTLALKAPADGPDVQQAALARLRNDPRVRFAEPLEPGTAER